MANDFVDSRWRWFFFAVDLSFFFAFGFRDSDVFAETSTVAEFMCAATFTANANNKPHEIRPIHATTLACAIKMCKKKASREIWHDPMDAKTKHKSK